YLVGGQNSPTGLAETLFLMLDLKQPEALRQWETGPSFPGKARIQAVAAAHGGAFYLFSGFSLSHGKDKVLERQLLTDAFRFVPGKNQSSGTWEQLPDMPRGVAAAPSPAMSIGQNHIFIPGGLDENTLL